MMSILNTFETRDDSTDYYDDEISNSHPVGTLLYGAFFLFLVASIISVILLVIRRRRFAQQQALLPVHHRSGHHRSLTISTTPTNGNGESVFVYDEKMNLIANSSSPPNSAIPEIRITFPDEDDHANEPKSGRVVVVRITDTGSEGLEPLHHDHLPPYQQRDADRFQSLDLERMGGLREKPTTAQQWS